MDGSQAGNDNSGLILKKVSSLWQLSRFFKRAFCKLKRFPKTHESKILGKLSILPIIKIQSLLLAWG